jgi:hypothetical protein
MVTYPISQGNIQDLLNLFITIDIAILSLSFAAIAVKPEVFSPIKKDFRNFLLITSFWMLISLIFYCVSLFDTFYNTILFKIMLAGIMILTIIITYNLIFFMITTFDRIVIDP